MTDTISLTWTRIDGAHYAIAGHNIIRVAKNPKPRRPAIKWQLSTLNVLGVKPFERGGVPTKANDLFRHKGHTELLGDAKAWAAEWATGNFNYEVVDLGTVAGPRGYDGFAAVMRELRDRFVMGEGVTEPQRRLINRSLQFVTGIVREAIREKTASRS